MKIRVVAQISRNDNYDRGEDASLNGGFRQQEWGFKETGA